MAAIESIYAEYVIETKKAIDQINNLLRNVTSANEKIISTSLKAEKEVSKVGDAFQENISDVKKFSTAVSESFEQTNNKTNQLIKTLASVTASIGAIAIFKDIESIGMSFTTQLSRLQAATSASENDMKKLRAEAERLGATTQFSASEAASAMVELGKAGLNAQQIFEGTQQVLNLAAAGELSLSEAASIAADTMSQFNLKAKDMGLIADVIAATANSSTISVREVAESMKYAGSVANSLKVPIEQVGAMISIMGSAGIKASMSGTAMRSMLLRLSDPPREAAESLKMLNIQITNSQGQMRPLTEIFSELNKKFKDLSEVKQVELLSKIFGAEAASGVLALIKAGGDRIAELSLKLKEQGKAADVASKNTDNLEGDYKALASAIEGIKITIFSALEPSLRSVIQMFTTIAQSINDFTQRFPNLTKAIVLLVTTITGLGIAIVGANGLMTAFKSLELGLALSNAKVLLFGRTLDATAATAPSKWMSILGPFGLALGVTAIAYTIYIDIVERRKKEREELASKLEKEEFEKIISTVDKSKFFNAIKKINETDLSNFKTQLEQIKETIDKVEVGNLTPDSKELQNFIPFMNKLIGMTSQFDTKLSSILEGKKNYYSDTKTFFVSQIPVVRASVKVLEQLFDESSKNISSSLDSNKSSFRSFASSVQTQGKSIIEIFDDVQDAIKSDSFKELKLDLQLQNTEKTKKDIQNLKLFIEMFGGTLSDIQNKKNIDVKIKIPETDAVKSRLDEIKNKILDVSKIAKTYQVKVEAKQESDFWRDWEKATGSLNDIENTMKSLEKQYETTSKTLSSGGIAEGIAATAKSIEQTISKLGNAYMNLLKSQEQLKMTKLKNEYTKFNTFIEYTIALLEREIENFEKAQEEKIKAVENRINEIERLEREHLENLKKMKEEFDREEKERVDALFRQEAETLRAKYEEKISLLRQEVLDQDQFNTLQAIAFEDFQNELQRKRDEYDELYRQNVEQKNKEFSQREEEVKNQSIAQKEEEEKKKQQLEEETTKKKEEAEKKKAELRMRQAQIQYMFDLAQFQSDKHLKIQQAKLSLAQTLLNAVSGIASSFAHSGAIGFAIGIVLSTILSALAIQTAANVIATINATTPPPPPPAVFGFSKGGLVEGGVNDEDSVHAMLTPGELIVPKKDFNDVVSSYVNKNETAKEINVNLTFNNNFAKEVDEDYIINEITNQVVKSIRFGNQEYSY